MQCIQLCSNAFSYVCPPVCSLSSFPSTKHLRIQSCIVHPMHQNILSLLVSSPHPQLPLRSIFKHFIYRPSLLSFIPLPLTPTLTAVRLPLQEYSSITGHLHLHPHPFVDSSSINALHLQSSHPSDCTKWRNNELAKQPFPLTVWHFLCRFFNYVSVFVTYVKLFAKDVTHSLCNAFSCSSRGIHGQLN